MGYYDIFPDAGIADIGGVHENRPRAPRSARRALRAVAISINAVVTTLTEKFKVQCFRFHIELGTGNVGGRFMKIIYTDVLVIGGGLACLRRRIGAERAGHALLCRPIVA